MEEKESSAPKQVPGAPKKPERPSQEMELMLLLTLMRLFWHTPQQDLLMMTMLSWTLHELHMAKQKAAERKRRLWQLLL